MRDAIIKVVLGGAILAFYSIVALWPVIKQYRIGRQVKRMEKE
jgi:hypothetical protein